MKDRYGREIDYMRISITDRCDLRCNYCMPACVPDIPHDDILRYEEILRLCRVATTLGITRFKITGGEPFVRKGAMDFIARLKAEPGIESVTVTTNGTMLRGVLHDLKTAGVDGVNISLDAVDAPKYMEITSVDSAQEVLAAVEECAAIGIRTKVNCVLLGCNSDQIGPLALLARDLPVDVRFIELMPIGYGRGLAEPSCDTVMAQLADLYPDLHRVDEKPGNGPAVYYRSARLTGRIGIIAANSRRFCSDCNRVRLTSTGFIKPCLCYDTGIGLRSLMRGGATDRQLAGAMRAAIYDKPPAHCFSNAEEVTEKGKMHQIGG